MKKITLSLSVLLAPLVQAGIDLSQYNPAAATVNGENYPRVITEVYSKYKEKKPIEVALRSMLEKTALVNRAPMFWDIRTKLRGARIGNDIYDYLHDHGVTADIKAEGKVSSDKSYDVADKIIGKFLSNFDVPGFEKEFLTNHSEESFSVFNVYGGIKSLRSRDDYYATKLDASHSSLFDYGFYKYAKGFSKKIDNLHISLVSDDTMEVKAIENRRSDNSIRYGMYLSTLHGEEVIYILDGKTTKGHSAQCIKSLGASQFEFCDASGKLLGEEPALIGILQKCDKKKPCAFDEDNFKLFKKLSKRTLLSKELDQIEDVFDDKSQYTLRLETPLIPVAGGDFPAGVAINDAKFDELNIIAAKDAKYHGLKVKKIYTDYDEKTPLSVTYTFDNRSCRKTAKQGEECLDLGESIYMAIPSEFHDLPISDITISHRQNPKFNRGKDTFNSWTGTKTLDNYPSFVAAQVYSLNHPYKYAWRYWGGHISGPNGGKYSELKKRGSWEFDNLYEWPLHGHRPSHLKQGANKSLLFGKYIRVFADTGKNSNIVDYDPAYVHAVTVKFLPPAADNYLEFSFTNKPTSFGDPITMKGRQYGGGPKFSGQYPGAVTLKSFRVGNSGSLKGTGWDTDSGKRAAIEYDLPTGKILKSIDIAAGDTHPDGAANKDGGIGSLGAAKLHVELLSSDGDEKLIDEANLGPKGVTSGNPTDLTRRIKTGDKIRIYSTGDRAYIMGIRIGLDD